VPTRPVLLLAALAVLLTACSGAPNPGVASSPASDGRIRVLTSTSMWAGVARAVGGNAVAVTALLDAPGRDPHDYEATPRDQLSALRSDVIVVNGGGYDDFLRRLARPVRHARLIDVVAVSRRTAGPGLNEHLWYDLPTVARLAESLRAAFTALRPDERAAFEARAARFVAGVHDLEARERSLRPLAAGRDAAITEPVAGDLLAAVGLRVATPEAYSAGVESTGDVAPAVLLQQLRLLTGRRVVLLAADVEVSSPTVDRTVAAARTAGVPVLEAREILPPGVDYLPWMRSQIATVASAVEQ
jgi:zinc/manganese transport system substrate-binding protein